MAMLSKLRHGARQLKSGGGSQRRFGVFSRMTHSDSPVSPYQRMDGGVRHVTPAEAEVRKEKGQRCSDAKEVDKKSKKKRSWKRFRQVALSTCRYIGMGAAHMSPASMYSSPDYYIDPKNWNKSFSPSYKPNNSASQQTPHWTSHLMFAGW